MWDDHIVPCAESSKAGRGRLANSSVNENKRLCTITSQLLPQMGTRCLSSVVGFGFLFLVCLHGFPVGNSFIVMDTGKPRAREGLPKVICSEDWRGDAWERLKVGCRLGWAIGFPAKEP